MSLDPAFISGLVAGEGCFSISARNGGQSRGCAFALALRADDTELLEDVVASAGCGHLYAKAAHATSKPQIVWSVASMADCLSLAEVLADTLRLSKKALEFEVWRRAVQVWTSGGTDRNARMDDLAADLRCLRDPRLDAPWPVDINPPYFESFLAGFVTGEGHFGAAPSSARFAVNLRSDDRRVLDALALGTGTGDVTVEPPTSGSPNPRASWRVNRREEQRDLVAIFDRNPPRGRKGRTYELWRDLVLLRRPSVSRLTPRQAAERARLTEEICASIRYRPPGRPPKRSARRPRTEERVIEALRAWIDECGPPYTATTYMRYRQDHPDIPNRDTIARVFGSWHAGLVAAGVPVDRTWPVEALRSIAAVAEPARALRRAERRAAVVDAIRACMDELGRAPRAMEFFRWRLAHAPGTPTQADLYRLFDGGFPEALDGAARGAPPLIRMK